MRRLFVLLTLALFGSIALTSSASAQTPYSSDAGLQAARAAAEDSLASDLVLMSVLTSGQNPLTGGEGFNIETGESPFWLYVFYSPSLDKGAAEVVLQLIPGLFIAQGGTFDTTDGMTAAMQLMANLPYSSSTQMASAVRNNAEYQMFRAENGTVLPVLATLLKGTAPIPGMPDNFPVNDEIWTIAFQDDVDTTQQLVCFVASSSGQSFCFASEPSGIDDEAAPATLGVQMAPNPAVGTTRVTLTAPASGRSLEGVRLGLFDATGREVLDLTASLADNGYRHAEFDASSLPAGSYFCRAVGGGFNGVIGTIVLGR